MTQPTKKVIIGINQKKESDNLAKLADAFRPLVEAMINDPNVYFTRPAEIRHYQSHRATPRQPYRVTAE